MYMTTNIAHLSTFLTALPSTWSHSKGRGVGELLLGWLQKRVPCDVVSEWDTSSIEKEHIIFIILDSPFYFSSSTPIIMSCSGKNGADALGWWSCCLVLNSAGEWCRQVRCFHLQKTSTQLNLNSLFHHSWCAWGNFETNEGDEGGSEGRCCCLVDSRSSAILWICGMWDSCDARPVMATSTMAAPTVQTQSMVGGGEVGRMRVVLALRQSLERRYGRYGVGRLGSSWCDDNIIVKQQRERERRRQKRGNGETERKRRHYLNSLLKCVTYQILNH